MNKRLQQSLTNLRAKRELVQGSVGRHAIQIHREAIEIDKRDGRLDVGESIGHIC